MLKLKKKKKAAPKSSKQDRSAGNPQGITGRGNALLKIASTALPVAVIPLLLGFAYLMLLREPALQHEQVQRVASSFAVQQATNIEKLVAHLQLRVESAARSQLALSALGQPAGAELTQIEQSLSDFFPEAFSLKLIPIGEMGTADFKGGEGGLRNHIEVDLVRRTSLGESNGHEAYRFDDTWLTSFTGLVSQPEAPDQKAVIIVTVDNKLLSRRLGSLDTEAGQFALQQKPTAKGDKKTQVIARAGDGNATDYTSLADIPGSSWQVSFTPSAALLQKLSLSPLPLLAVMLIALLAALGSLAVVVLRFPRALAAELEKITTAADKKSPLELAIPQLVNIAKQLRRATLRAMRQPAKTAVTPDAAASDDLTNPMFHSDSILDNTEEVLELDLPGTAVEERPVSAADFPEHIFRAYDIRGDAETELGDELVFNIGKALGTVAGEMDEQTLIVGCDGRTSSPRIKSTLIRALMDSGRDVIDIGLVPTPLLYYATRHLNCRSGIMITGSHNPAQDNGLKVVLNRQTIASGGIQNIRDMVVRGNFSKGTGRMIREEIIPDYIDEVLQDIAIAMPLKIVIDAGNGATSDIAPNLFEDLGCEVVPLYCHVDGNFPNHPPDTSNEDNLAELARVVQSEEADFGVAFDGDGDRLAVVTSTGQIVRSDILLMIYAQDVVSRNPGADVVFDVKCSRRVNDLVTAHGGRPVLWKTGHAFMKEKMAETDALLGGEFSGHMFFGERWYGFDDGMYAAGRLAEILSTLGHSLDETIADFATTFNTPEIIIPVPEESKFALMDKIIADADFSSGKANTIDGLRVDFQDGWGLVRASNTSAALTARFEADTEETLELIKEEFRTQLSLADPNLSINF